MYTRPSFAALAALCVLSAPAAAADHKTGKIDFERPSGIARLTAMPGETINLYRGVDLYIPADIEAGERVPLLVLLPGTKGSGLNMVETLKGIADRKGFALLGLSPKRDDFSAVENFLDDRSKGRPHAIEDWPAPRFGKDIDRLEAALDRVTQIAPIDPERIGLFGFSRGANWALMIGTANPDIFATVAALSPGPLVIPRDAAGGQAIFLSHGDRDQVLPFDETACRTRTRLAGLGYGVEFHAFEGEHDIPMEITAAALEHFVAGRDGRAHSEALRAPSC